MRLYTRRVPNVREFLKRLSVGYLVKSSISEGCRGQGRSFAIDHRCPFRSGTLFSGEVEDGCSCAREAGVCSYGTNWRSSFQSAALEVATRAMPRWSGIPQAILKVPVAGGYLGDRTRKTAGGAQISPAGGASGALHCSSRRRPALYSFRLLRTGSAPRSLVIYGLLTKPRDVRCRSGGQPKRTGDVMKLKLLLEGDGRRQDPTHTDTKFLCSDTNSEILGSVPELR
jgi:hypothetical protein